MADPFEFDRRAFLQAGTAALVGTAVVAERASAGSSLFVSEPVDVDPKRGYAAAVVVGGWPLIHTEQFSVPREKSYSVQIEKLFKEMARRIHAVSRGEHTIIKLNFYLRPGLEPVEPFAIYDALVKRFGDWPPAVSFVVGNLADPNADLAVDVVAVDHRDSNAWSRGATGKVERTPGIAILPPIHKLYVSGDAKPGDIATATLETLKSLEQTLKFAGCDWSHVVQLKSFLDPIEKADEVRGVMKTFFGERPVPVLSFVEWRSPNLPIEIELVAACPPRELKLLPPAVEFLTPPGTTASPVYSRAARMHSDLTLYFSGLYGEKKPDVPGRLREIFGALGRRLKELESDLNHLVKATYYVTDEEASKQLGVIRPEFYDPKRPPAASRAMVAGTGRQGHSITLDMIAVPRNDKPESNPPSNKASGTGK